MSEFMREALPIIFMYGCVLALGPFIGIAMWMAFDGDRLREDDAVAAPAAAPQVTVAERERGATTAGRQVTTEATSAA